MGDGACSDIGDDFHVAVRVRGEAGLGRDQVIIPDAETTPAHALRIGVLREGEMVVGVKPAMVGAAEGFKRPDFDHWDLPVGNAVGLYIVAIATMYKTGVLS
jgi:hypothetical protein